MASNPLTDVLTPTLRKYLYALLFLAGIVYGAIQASGGDWKKAVPAILAGLLGATAASNVSGPVQGD